MNSLIEYLLNKFFVGVTAGDIPKDIRVLNSYTIELIFNDESKMQVIFDKAEGSIYTVNTDRLETGRSTQINNKINAAKDELLNYLK